MCVKEFLGYNCGHCSIPFLRQCPLTESNPIYPPCKLPAERPIFTNENCHACARVLWNIKVLKEEDEHRKRHQQGECECEVMFDAEERERRMIPRGGKGKGKGRDIVLAQGEYSHGQDRDISHAGGGGESAYQQYRQASEDLPANQRIAMGGGQQQNPIRATDAQLAAYEYVGYYVGSSNQSDSALALVEKGYGFPQGGYVHQEQLWEGQMRIGQPGSGMNWYPEEAANLMLTLPTLPSLPTPLVFVDKAPRNWQKARSEPYENIGHHVSPTAVPKETSEVAEVVEVPQVGDVAISEEVERDEVTSGPVVVSSDSGKTVSK